MVLRCQYGQAAYQYLAAGQITQALDANQWSVADKRGHALQDFIASVMKVSVQLSLLALASSPQLDGSSRYFRSSLHHDFSFSAS